MYVHARFKANGSATAQEAYINYRAFQTLLRPDLGALQCSVRRNNLEFRFHLPQQTQPSKCFTKRSATSAGCV